MVKKIGYVMVVTLLMIWSMAVPAEASQNWMQVYTHIEQMIHEGVEQYNNHDIDAAKKTVNVLVCHYCYMELYGAVS